MLDKTHITKEELYCFEIVSNPVEIANYVEDESIKNGNYLTEELSNYCKFVGIDIVKLFKILPISFQEQAKQEFIIRKLTTYNLSGKYIVFFYLDFNVEVFVV
jgi:hypothetical protein